MLQGFADGGLEFRRRASGALSLQGRFPYNTRAVLSDGGRTGRPRKEAIASRAFAFRLDRPEEDIHLLVGHSYDRPLASRGAGTLDIRDSDDAVTFTATISEELQDVTWVQDVLRAMNAGLIVGLSPGFRIPPRRAVANAERVEEENPAEGTALIRTVLAALLFEMSLVTRPAYPETQVEARSWEKTDAGLIKPQRIQRWRA